MTETIKCGNCGKDSGIERGENDGANAAQIQRIGWTAKLPVLVGIPGWLFSCSTGCKTELFAQKRAEYRVSDEQVAEAAEIVSEAKKKIPQMAKETCEFMGKVQNILKSKRKI